MKKAAFTLFIITTLALNVFSQDTTTVTKDTIVKPVTYSKVIQVDSVGKADLYASLYDWFISNYKSANDAMQMSDKTTGVIVGKGVIIYDFGKTAYTCYKGYIKYTIKVTVKDNRYKVELQDFYHTVNLGNSASCALGDVTTTTVYAEKGIAKSFHNAVWSDIKVKVEQFSNDIFTSLETKTKTIKTATPGGNW